MHDEELTGSGIREHGPGHGKNPAFMKQGIFDAVGGEFPFDGIIQMLALQIAPSALNHESFDDAVEDEPSIKAGVHELDEVGAGVGGGVPIQFRLHHAIIFYGDANHVSKPLFALHYRTWRQSKLAKSKVRGILSPGPSRGNQMKVLLFAILDHVTATEQLIRSLSKEGYNGTVIPTEGMHHVFPQFYDSKSTAVSLAALTDDLPSGNFTLFIVLEEEELAKVQNEIRSATLNFQKIRGGMFVLPVTSVEGFF